MSQQKPLRLRGEDLNTPYKGRFKVSQIYKGLSHKGLDLVGIDSKDICSTVDGIVEASQSDTHHTGGMGLYVRIKENGTGYRHYFAHLNRSYVKVGQSVKVGDVIGVEGSTGHSTGSHLHYEIRREPNNMTFLDVSKISGIPNKLGICEGVGKMKETSVMVGNMEVKGKLINGVTYVPVRDLVKAVKTGLKVTWSEKEGAEVKL